MSHHRRASSSLLAVAGGLLCATVAAQTPLDSAAIAIRSRQALVALDRYLETWNSRNPALWASSLHYPHVRPGPGEFAVSKTPAEYAAGVNFQQTLATGWHHSEWISRDVLQVGVDKVHVAGSWQRYTEDGRPQATSAITYIVTSHEGRWAIQSRFAAGAAGADATAVARNSAAALEAVKTFMQAWNSHDPNALAASLHYPHVRIADNLVEIWNSPDEFRAGPEPGRQRTWYQTRLDQSKAVQTDLNGVNVTVAFSRLGRDGRVLSTDEGVFLVTLRDGAWKIQARSTMGS